MMWMVMHGMLQHPAAKTVSGVTSTIASGVSTAEVANATTGIVVALCTAAALIIGVARSNKNNRRRAVVERRKQFRRGYLARDRELLQVQSDATYWRDYALTHRRQGAPNAQPPLVVPPPIPLDEDDDTEEEGDTP